MSDLDEAIAEVKRVTPEDQPWTIFDFWPNPDDIEIPPTCVHLATILNAVAAGELIPASERDAAVAAALEEAAKPEVLLAGLRSEAVDQIGMKIAAISENILALINRPQADALAQVWAEAVKIKPLVWEYDNWTSRIRAKAPIGDYVLWWGYNGEKHSLRFDDRAVTEHPTMEAAKAAAQADYNARIRAAIGGVELPRPTCCRARFAGSFSAELKNRATSSPADLSLAQPSFQTARPAATGAIPSPDGTAAPRPPFQRRTRPMSDAPELLTIRYTNWRGETADRTIKPIRIWWGNTEWHPNNQWMMEAYDVGKGEQRDFALADMVFLTTTEALAASPEVQALIAEAVAGALAPIREAVTQYHLALDRREHGGVAGGRLQDDVQRILDMPWRQGAAIRASGEGER